MDASADTRRRQLSFTIEHQRQQRQAPLSSRPIKRQKKCQPENIFLCVQVHIQLKKDSDVRVFFFFFFFLSVNSICCSPPLLPTYALPFIFLIPPSWHLLLCGVLHGWGIEFTQIKQPLRSAVSWEMKHVEIEGHLYSNITRTWLILRIVPDIPAPI